MMEAVAEQGCARARARARHLGVRHHRVQGRMVAAGHRRARAARHRRLPLRDAREADAHRATGTWSGRVGSPRPSSTRAETGLDRIIEEVGGWFTRYPGRPDYFTHWGEAFRYAASVIGLPIGDYPHSRPAAGHPAGGRQGSRSASSTRAWGSSSSSRPCRRPARTSVCEGGLTKVRSPRVTIQLDTPDTTAIVTGIVGCSPFAEGVPVALVPRGRGVAMTTAARASYHCPPCEVGWSGGSHCFCCGRRGSFGPLLPVAVAPPGTTWCGPLGRPASFRTARLVADRHAEEASLSRR